MPSKPKFRQSYENQQSLRTDTKAFQQEGKDAAKKTDADNRDGYNNQQNQGQWGEDRANSNQNLSDSNNRPVNQSGREDRQREVPMQDDTPRPDPEKSQLN